MGTYTSDFSVFVKQLRYGLSWPNKSDAAHLGVGLSCSTDSWGSSAPTANDLRRRFCCLDTAGLRHVAVFGGNFDYLPQYAPFLRAFVSGADMCLNAPELSSAALVPRCAALGVVARPGAAPTATAGLKY